MNCHFDGVGRLALQPETRDGQEALIELAERHPRSWWTQEIADYVGLDADLARAATYAPREGQADPGARALVIPTSSVFSRLR